MDDRLRESVRRALALGVGWTALAFAATGLANMGASGARKKHRERLSAAVNAALPAISPDPYIEDEEMGKERQSGLEKASEEKKPLKLRDFVVPEVFRKGDPMYTAALAGTGIVGGISLGVLLARKLIKRKEETKLDSEIERARQELDQIAYIEYRRTRGLDKTATGKKQTTLDTVLAGARQAYPLYAVGLFGITYLIASKYLKSIDENQISLKAIEQLASDRAAISPPPMLMSLPPPVRGEEEEPEDKGPSARLRRNLEKLRAEEAESAIDL